MSRRQIIEAALVYTGGGFQERAQVEIDEQGEIAQVGPALGEPTRRLPNQALLPGMVNAHSHAFQRGLRGSGESFPAGAGSFWSWREAMYELVSEMDADSAYDLSHMAFSEMRDAGITSVGEFHYLHHEHDRGGFRLDEAILAAARDSGIRIVLLQTMYSAGGIGKELAGGQRRFRIDNVDDYWKQLDTLAALLSGPNQSLGVVAHSVRAVSADDLVSLHAEAVRRGLVFHTHLEEQRQEIESCVEAYGMTPMAFICERLQIDERFTAVHCTHTDPAEMERYLECGGNVCICPLTEANLGDGIADVPGIRDADGVICVGTDSNARLCMTEELRWLEYVQRLDGEVRGVITDDKGDCASALWEIGTINGARSLGLNTGEIKPGKAADLIAVDLDAPCMAGASPSTLLGAFIFGAGAGAIESTCVGGEWRESAT